MSYDLFDQSINTVKLKHNSREIFGLKSYLKTAHWGQSLCLSLGFIQNYPKPALNIIQHWFKSHSIWPTLIAKMKLTYQ